MIGGQLNQKIDVLALINSSAPVVVPSDYVGMHFRGWPLCNPGYSQEKPWPAAVTTDPDVNGLRFKSYRTHDNGFSHWFQIETAPSVYDPSKLSALDAIVTKMRSAGRTVIYQVYGTPAFYVANADPYRLTPDTYGHPGGQCYPGATVGIEGVSGITALGNFVTMIVNRYNKPGGAWYDAHFATLGKGVQIVEPWNEADIGTDFNFFRGTSGQIVDLAYTVYTAVKSADASVIVLSPSFGLFDYADNYLNSVGSINAGVHGYSCCDAVAVHTYGHTLPYGSFSDIGKSVDILNGYNCGLLRYKSRVKGRPYQDYPMYLTECGISVSYDLSGPNQGYPTAGGALDLAINQSATWRYKYWARMLMLWAAFGFKMAIVYCYDDIFCAWPCNDKPGDGVNGACSLINDRVAGKTITACTYSIGGEVTLAFSDSTFLTV